MYLYFIIISVAFLNDSMEALISKTFNMALFDSGCTKTVCGET